MTPRFDDYVAKIWSLPDDPADNDVVTSNFLLEKEGRIEVYYAPLHGVTTDAKIIIVGITPGIQQMVAAFAEARRLLHEGMKPPHLFKEIRRRMAFKGPMRTNLINMLDKIGVVDRLEIASTARLFDDASHLLHSTSALRYPVFNRGQNYTGSNPPIHRSPTAQVPPHLHFAAGTRSSTRCVDRAAGQGGNHRCAEDNRFRQGTKSTA